MYRVRVASVVITCLAVMAVACTGNPANGRVAATQKMAETPDIAAQGPSLSADPSPQATQAAPTVEREPNPGPVPNPQPNISPASARPEPTLTSPPAMAQTAASPDPTSTAIPDPPPTATAQPSMTTPQAAVPTSTSAPIPSATAESGERELKIVTLLPFDAIPAILNPEFISAEEADEQLESDSLVLGLSINGDRRAYSLPALSSYEIVNDTVGGQPVAVTW